jgi:hypothetical protein
LLDKQLAFSTVAPESAAARAGIVAGDRLIYATLPLRGRRFALFQEEVPGGAPISFQIVHGRQTRWVTLRAESSAGAGRAEALTYAAAGLALGLVGLFLVLVRPSLMTWSFALIAPPLLVPWPLLFWSQQSRSGAAIAFDVALALLYAGQTAGIMLFASRFPNDRPLGVARIVDRLSAPVGLAVAALYLYAYLQVRFSSAPPAHLISLANVAIVVPSAAALVALIATYVTTPGGARTRLLPVIGSFVLLILTGVLQQVGSELTTNDRVLVALSLAFSASPALVAAAVAYGVIRHRVMDVSFIISRTLVYTILTLGAVALFTLIEYVFGRLLERQGVATVLNILAAVGLGISLNLLHGRLDDWIDRVLFRRRHLAERRLSAVARGLPHAVTAQAIDSSLVDEPLDAFALSSAALFRHDNGLYRRVCAQGWTDAQASTLDEDDALALRLRTDLEALEPRDLRWPRTDLPDGQQQAIYAVPVVVSHHLEAIALYGAHRTGEDLDPDERRSLRDLAVAAAAGYDHVAAAALRQRLANVEAENAALRGVEQKLTELLNQRLS